MGDNRTIGEKLSSAYRPFIGQKMDGPPNSVVEALAKDIDRNFAAHVQQIKDLEDIAKDLYKQLSWCYTVPACMDYDVKKAMDKYDRYHKITNIMNDANNRDNKEPAR